MRYWDQYERDPPHWYFTPPPRKTSLTLEDVLEAKKWWEEQEREMKHKQHDHNKDKKGIILSMPMIYGTLFIASQLCNILFVVGVIKFLK